MQNQEYLARILRTKPETIFELEKKMSVITGKKEVIDNIVKENEQRIKHTLSSIDCSDYKSESVFNALIKKIKEDDWSLYELFQKPTGTTIEGLAPVFEAALKLANIEPLFVLKKDRAAEILKKNPPLNIIKALKYKNVGELLKKEDLTEIFSALRFVESKEWMHKTFDETYKQLTPKDFEKRKVDVRVLSGKWLEIAEKFVEKKYHNISHLKELGVIFVIPLQIDTPGETLRLFSLILHYLHEVEFYSKLFEKEVKNPDLPTGEAGFGNRIISLLKGEVLERVKPGEDGMNWMIIQRYLAKDDENDPRLFIPHVNPEALHWKKAQQDISRLGRRFKDIDLEMWRELDWVGGYFGKKGDGEDLVSFDLVDNVMALVKNHESIKYLYHHQEALWNHIFEEYMGNHNLEKLMIENFGKGTINLSG